MLFGCSDKCFNNVALRINGEQVAPNKSTLNLYVSSRLSGSLGLLSQKNRVASRSSPSNSICRNAFSMSDVMAYLPRRKLVNISVSLFSCGGDEDRQSFRLGDSAFWRQLQS